MDILHSAVTSQKQCRRKGGLDSGFHLSSFIQEGIPHSQEDVADQAVHKGHQKPVEGDEGDIDLMLLEMSSEARQLLCQEVFEDSLIYLKLTKKKTMNYLLKAVRC